MKAKFTEFKNNTKWCSGVVGNVLFEAKLFDGRSDFGIDGGRISKLHIYDANENYVEYDRGWSIKPNKKTKLYYDAVIELLENSPKRFTKK